MRPLKIILFILFVFVLLIGMYLFLDLNHWSKKDINDYTEVLLPQPIHSIKDGLNYAEERAKTWHKGAILINIRVSFEDKKSFEDKQGIISYQFYVLNEDFFGWKHNTCDVFIDMQKQSIVRFLFFHGLLKGGRDELDTSEWKIDVSDVVDIVKNNNKGFMDQLDDAAVIILHAGKRKWALDVLKDTDSSRAIIARMIFDPQTGKIIEEESFH